MAEAGRGEGEERDGAGNEQDAGTGAGQAGQLSGSAYRDCTGGRRALAIALRRSSLPSVAAAIVSGHSKLRFRFLVSRAALELGVLRFSSILQLKGIVKLQ